MDASFAEHFASCLPHVGSLMLFGITPLLESSLALCREREGKGGKGNANLYKLLDIIESEMKQSSTILSSSHKHWKRTCFVSCTSMFSLNPTDGEDSSCSNLEFPVCLYHLLNIDNSEILGKTTPGEKTNGICRGNCDVSSEYNWTKCVLCKYPTKIMVVFNFAFPHFKFGALRGIDLELFISSFVDLMWKEQVKKGKFSADTLLFRCSDCGAMKFPLSEKGLLLGWSVDTLSTREGTIQKEKSFRPRLSHTKEYCKGTFDALPVRITSDEAIEWVDRFFKFNFRPSQTVPTASLKVINIRHNILICCRSWRKTPGSM